MQSKISFRSETNDYIYSVRAKYDSCGKFTTDVLTCNFLVQLYKDNFLLLIVYFQINAGFSCNVEKITSNTDAFFQLPQFQIF